MATILIVDDSVSVLAHLEQCVASAGYHVRTARCGNEAVRVLDEIAVDLVVTDIYMPDMDGLELLQHARAQGVNVPFIAMSSKPEHLSMFRVARALGAVTFLSKPFEPDRLIKAMHTVLADRCVAAAGTLFEAQKSNPATNVPSKNLESTK